MLTTGSDLETARRAAAELVRAVQNLRRHYGDTLDMHRLVIDVERLSADLDTMKPPRPRPAPDVVMVPDTPYPPAMWAGSEDEGVGRR